MDYQNLLIETENGIITLTINRPKALNALNAEVMKELDHFFSSDLPKRAGVIGVIITGSGGRAFVAGADITEFLKISGEKGQQISKFGQDVFFRIERSKVPVVAVVNGFALGGGCELAMSCHLRVAENHAKFGQPEVNLGLIPGYGGTQRLLQYLGKSKAVELLLTADMIDAEEALKLGLVNYVTEKEAGKEKAIELIEKISSKGPLAISKTIEAVNAYFNAGENGFIKEHLNFGDVIGSDDSQEGVTAFLEKRKAAFKRK
jgi:enoyl-CoA hydratase